MRLEIGSPAERTFAMDFWKAIPECSQSLPSSRVKASMRDTDHFVRVIRVVPRINSLRPLRKQGVEAIFIAVPDNASNCFY